MAKLNALQIVNAVLRNIGEASDLSALTSLTGIQLVVWDKLTEALQEITTDQNTRWQFLESLGEIPLSTGNYQYTITGLTTGSDMQFEDRESLRSPDANRKVTYISPQEFDKKHPKGITTDITGWPKEYTKYNGQFVFDHQATAGENGDIVHFRYWKYPSYYSTDTSTGTGDIPEPFDRTLLVALTTMKVLIYLGSDEATAYRVQVYGNGDDIEGSLATLKQLYSSPVLKPRVTYQF